MSSKVKILYPDGDDPKEISLRSCKTVNDLFYYLINEYRWQLMDGKLLSQAQADVEYFRGINKYPYPIIVGFTKDNFRLDIIKGKKVTKTNGK